MSHPFTIPLYGSTWLLWRIERWETPETAVRAASARYREKYGRSPETVLTAPGVTVPGVAVVAWSGCRPGEVWVGPIEQVGQVGRPLAPLPDWLRRPVPAAWQAGAEHLPGASPPSADDRVIGDDEGEPCA